MPEPANVLLSGIVGSTAYGLARPGSDIDRLGVYAAPTISLHGLNPPTGRDATTHTTKPDVTMHEAAKYARLCLNANPSVIELLWLPDHLYETRTALGDHLIDIRDAFLSAPRVRDAYLGYAISQFRRLEARGDGSFSADTRKRTAKHARHLARLVHQGLQLYAHGTLDIAVANPDWYWNFGEGVADGDLDLARFVLEEARVDFDGLTTPLPDEPDRDAAEAWLHAVRAAHLPAPTRYTAAPAAARTRDPDGWSPAWRDPYERLLRGPDVSLARIRALDRVPVSSAALAAPYCDPAFGLRSLLGLRDPEQTAEVDRTIGRRRQADAQQQAVTPAPSRVPAPGLPTERGHPMPHSNPADIELDGQDLDRMTRAELAELHGPEHAIAEVLDEWNHREHGLTSSSHGVGCSSTCSRPRATASHPSTSPAAHCRRLPNRPEHHMRKMPTIFVRDWENDPSRVTRQPNPDCAWVFDGEGIPTRKHDGTCIGFADGRWWARREVKPGKTPPPGFELLQVDERTGKRTGWVPVEQSSFARYHAEALNPATPGPGLAVAPDWAPGTYELIGPKINGNPERQERHVLIQHGSQELANVPLDYDGLAVWLHSHPYEGIVWHHPDGRMAKLKRRDVPRPLHPSSCSDEPGPEKADWNPSGHYRGRHPTGLAQTAGAEGTPFAWEGNGADGAFDTSSLTEPLSGGVAE
ncbi:RNA ligase 1 family protein [Spirillospora sp. CA-294931]|uniref:RNA ligase 1 family protein n=1 Tax=Spirillospora sp. CA-294931 TaxID=3240042 RepID=UPI003D8DAD8E